MTFSKEQLTRIIESADEVITALAGTNEDCHRESDDMIRLWDYLNDVAAPPAIVKKLAEMALAGMEAESVAYMRIDGDDVEYNGHNEFSDGGRGFPLYTAPQPLTTSERAELENYRNAHVVPGDIDARMKTAGMLSAAELIAGQPIDAFVKHAGVVDMGSLLHWSEMRRAEFLRMQACYELGDKEKDDLYEWVISHVAVFSELHVNIRAAMQSGAVKGGWVMVPVEPTEDMIIAGFEAELREEFRDPEAYEAFEAMSGCEQAALQTKWCWAAMISAAPGQEL